MYLISTTSVEPSIVYIPSLIKLVLFVTVLLPLNTLSTLSARSLSSPLVGIAGVGFSSTVANENVATAAVS